MSSNKESHKGAVIGAVGVITAALITVVGGVIFVQQKNSNSSSPPSLYGTGFTNSGTTETQTSLAFTITNVLGNMQISEEAHIYIEGQLKTTLLVNQQKTLVSSRIEVPKAGSYRYTVVADGVFADQYGQPYRSQGRGDGVIEVRDGSKFKLEATQHGIRITPE